MSTKTLCTPNEPKPIYYCEYVVQRGPNKGKQCTRQLRVAAAKERGFCCQHSEEFMQKNLEYANNRNRAVRQQLYEVIINNEGNKILKKSPPVEIHRICLESRAKHYERQGAKIRLLDISEEHVEGEDTQLTAAYKHYRTAFNNASK